MEEENSESTDEEDLKANPEFVQILAPYSEVSCWISSFIQDKREQINLQNVQDFCVSQELRQNCARIDAVLVKRKGTTSHITVKDIKNYCGPQEKIDTASNSVQPDKIIPRKKVFTSEEVNAKIKKLNSLFGCESPTSSFQNNS
ncbi:MAP3K12-binding inhibitory protein 1-like [Rhodnius prolixus]|uniref:Uncharacterized protein n=1 Tax=Rhodnius prolixus TaxID=13249 RepID=T1HIP5_RHOPR